jgi:rhodanese-related sulfurtransferase
MNIPHLRLAAALDSLPRNRRLLVYCKSGSRSGRAVSFLRRAGFDAVNLAGGFDAWSAAAKPVEV